MTGGFEVNFNPGTVLEDVTLMVPRGTTMKLRNCTLRRVVLKVGGEATLSIEGCALETCYLAYYNQTIFMANRQAPDGSSLVLADEPARLRGTAPSLEMKDCVVADTTMSSAWLTGLSASNCTFAACVLEATSQDGNAASACYKNCIFTKSRLTGTNVMLTTSRCIFNNCECPDLLSAEAGAQLASPAVLELMWESSALALPEASQNGKIRFEKKSSIPGSGSSKSHEWNGEHLKVPGLPMAGAGSAVQLQQAWKMTDIGLPAPAVMPNGQTPAMPASQTPVAENTQITGTAAPDGVIFKSRLTQVNGLLISQLSTGGEAGQITRMSLSALPSLGQAPSTLKFNQDVGDSMGKALKEVSKFSQLRHGGWPVGHAMEIGFEDKYIGKDGPSAAVACALLLEAAISGKKWDPAFAVTGDMNADGSVQPIGGVQAKIRGATKGSCKIVAVPVKNEVAVSDILVQQGPGPLVGITVFGIKTFDDALLLADPEKPQALQNALADFDNMRAVMLRDPRQMMQLLRTPHAAQRLQALLTAAPNCYSAKYLLMYLQGRTPRTLSIGGSIEAAQNSAQAVVSAIDHDVDANVSSLKGDELGNSLNKLRQLRPQLDARVWQYVDGLVSYGEIIRGALLNPVRSDARYADLVSKANKAAGATKAAYEKLINDPQVREELGL